MIATGGLLAPPYAAAEHLDRTEERPGRQPADPGLHPEAVRTE